MHNPLNLDAFRTTDDDDAHRMQNFTSACVYLGHLSASGQPVVVTDVTNHHNTNESVAFVVVDEMQSSDLSVVVACVCVCVTGLFSGSSLKFTHERININVFSFYVFVFVFFPSPVSFSPFLFSMYVCLSNTRKYWPCKAFCFRFWCSVMGTHR